METEQQTKTNHTGVKEYKMYKVQGTGSTDKTSPFQAKVIKITRVIEFT